jgi:GGDEF domain-containing protein
MTPEQDVIKILQPLPHARDVQDYLIAMAVAITGKKKPPADYIHHLNNPSATFIDYRDIENIVSKIQDIFREKGYRTPWQLEDDLIRKIDPKIPDEAINLGNHYAASLLIPDNMAAYLQKPCVPLTMGLGALYNQTTGKPVSVIELDFSNMRGTNNHNANLIAAARGISSEDAIAEAESLTDQVAFIIAQTIRQKCLSPICKQENLKVIGLRTGGDELRLVIPDLEAKRAMDLLPGIHQAIETITAQTGGHDHAHTKEDYKFRGFSAAAGVFALEPVGEDAFRKKIREIDLVIRETKKLIGEIRANNSAFDALKPLYSTDPDLYTDGRKAAAHLAEVKQRIQTLKQDLTADLSDMEDPADMVAPEDIVDLVQPSNFLTPAQIQLGFYRQMNRDLDQKGLNLNEEQKRLLSIKATKFPAMDYATGTLAERDFPAMAGAALKVTDNLNTLARMDLQPIVLGISFHNLAGLNNALGHEEANRVLHQLAHGIIMPALEKEGISRENIILGHMGGGEFRAIIQPIVYDPDGYKRIIDPRLSTACALIAGETGKLSATAFSHILNPRTIFRPYENGITTTIVAGPYQERKTDTPGLWRGGAAMTYIGDLLKQAIIKKRKSYNPRTAASPANPAPDC